MTMRADWRSHGECTEEDLDLFFPDKSGGPLSTQIPVATAICARRPVAAICLSWAVETNQPQAVWGGPDEIEIQQIRRKRSRLKAA